MKTQKQAMANEKKLHQLITTCSLFLIEKRAVCRPQSILVQTAKHKAEL